MRFAKHPFAASAEPTAHETPVIRFARALVQNMLAVELDVVPAVPGYVILPRMMIVKKEAGAYTVAGVTTLVALHGTIAQNTPCFPWGNSPAFSVLVEPNEATYFTPPIWGNGQSAGLPYGPMNATAVVGRKLSLRSNGASPAGAGGDLLVRCYYDLLPFSLFDLKG